MTEISICIASTASKLATQARHLAIPSSAVHFRSVEGQGKPITVAIARGVSGSRKHAKVNVLIFERH